MLVNKYSLEENIVGYKFFKFLAKCALHISFWLLTISAKCAGLKAKYKIDELEDCKGFDVHFRWFNE